MRRLRPSSTSTTPGSGSETAAASACDPCRWADSSRARRRGGIARATRQFALCPEPEGALDLVARRAFLASDLGMRPQRARARRRRRKRWVTRRRGRKLGVGLGEAPRAGAPAEASLAPAEAGRPAVAPSIGEWAAQEVEVELVAAAGVCPTCAAKERPLGRVLDLPLAGNQRVYPRVLFGRRPCNEHVLALKSGWSSPRIRVRRTRGSRPPVTRRSSGRRKRLARRRARANPLQRQSRAPPALPS